MVEFRNTPRRPSIGDRESRELLNDLCIALRDVAVRERSLPKGEDAQASVREAVAIALELEKRHVDVRERLQQVSQETGWLMTHLLEDCKRFPDVVPRVRELDGIRRYFRCHYCKAAERPEEDVKYGACNACLGKLIQSFDSLAPIEGTVLLRTYNPEWRCAHADAETVLLGINYYEDGFLGPGECRRCLESALAVREASGDARG